MNKVKITVPVGDRITWAVEGYVEVEGIALGPFVIHRAVLPIEGWTVTHAKTGFVVQQGIPRKDRALWLAGELNGYPVWEFSVASAARNIAPKVLEKIREARGLAMSQIRFVHIQDRPE